jgi:hypothetical protein
MAVITTHDPRDHWKEMPSFYRNLIEQHGWKQQPMLNHVEHLAGQAWAQRLFPSTSHEALGLSHFEFYEERLVAAMVYIRYDGRGTESSPGSILMRDVSGVSRLDEPPSACSRRESLDGD